MTDKRRKAARANLSATNVLVTIELRSMNRLAVVVVDHHELLETDASIEVAHEPFDIFVVGERDTGAPKMRRVDAIADTVHIDATRSHSIVNLDQLLDALADAVAATRRVFEHQECALVVAGDRVQDLLDRLSDALDPHVDPRAAMRSDVHVDERGSVFGRHTKFMPQQLDRLRAERWVWPSKVCKVRRVHGEGAEAEFLHACTECWKLLRQLRASCPARRIAGEDLQPHRPNRRGAIGGLYESRPSRKVCAEHAVEASGCSRRSRRRESPAPRGWLRGRGRCRSSWCGHVPILPRAPRPRTPMRRSPPTERLARHRHSSDAREPCCVQRSRSSLEGCTARPNVVDENERGAGRDSPRDSGAHCDRLIECAPPLTAIEAMQGLHGTRAFEQFDHAPAVGCGSGELQRMVEAAFTASRRIGRDWHEEWRRAVDLVRNPRDHRRKGCTERCGKSRYAMKLQRAQRLAQTARV